MIKKQIPNALTLLNLFMGCCALYFVYSQQFLIVFYLILIALIADVFDGLAARWLKVDGGLGKQLDSLADVVSFGVVPGAILFKLIEYAFESKYGFGGQTFMKLSFCFGGFIFTLGAALRLARFNIDERQTTDFIGLATPAASMAVLGLMLIHNSGSGFFYDLLLNEYVLLFIAILLFLLMNSPIRMFSLKSLQKGWRGNEIILFFMILSPISLFLFKAAALFLLPLVYVLLSAIGYKGR